MATNITEIELDFTGNPSQDSSFELIFNDQNNDTFVLKETFVSKRSGVNQIEIGIDLEATIKNVYRALTMDYQGAFNNTIISGNKIKISPINNDWVFIDSVVAPSNLPINFTPYEIPVNEFKILLVEFLPASTNQCENVKIRITTNQPMTSYCVDQTCQTINSNVVEFERMRAVHYLFDAVKGSLIDTRLIKTPSPITNLINSLSVNVINSELGATATINAPFAYELILQYSLDNVIWQNSNVFSGLDNGNFVAYVKDVYGCTKSKPFTILNDNFGSPFVFVSKENSIRFIEPFDSFPTDENQKFCKSAAKLNYGYIQEFLNTDVITTQFKSNFQNISCLVREIVSGTVTNITPEKLTNNIGVKTKYNQVKKYKISDTQFGIYFESGSILDYDNNSFVDTYSLNGSLPAWAKLGNTIQIESAFYFIDSIAFDENVNAEVLIFNGTGPASVTNVDVSCKYNVHEYEVYELIVDMGLFSGKDIQVEIHNLDPNFGNYTIKSETIYVSESLNNYLEIRYFNSSNTNVIYSTGVQHVLRLPYNTVKSNDSDSNESYKTDTNTYLLNSKIHEVTDFEFIPFPLEFFRKLKIALSMDTVFINGVGYTKNAEFGKENLGSTNLYKLTASMIKNGFMFNSSQNNSEIISEEIINVPGLLEVNSNGYVGL